jgi:AmiR/NasT family two-component response regulator
VLIEQAKGMFAERYQIAPEEAFERMRRAARSHRLKLQDVAAELVASATPAAPAAEAFPRASV